MPSSFGVVECAANAADARAHHDGERILRREDCEALRALRLGHALDHLEHAAGVVGLLIVVAADDPALVVPEQVDADEAAVEQHLLVRHHDRHDRAADEGGVGREHQIDLVLIEQPVVERLRDRRIALVVVDDHLHGTAQHAALLVHLLEPQVVDRLVVRRRLGEGPGQPERSSDHDRIRLRGRRDRGLPASISTPAASARVALRRVIINFLIANLPWTCLRLALLVVWSGFVEPAATRGNFRDDRPVLVLVAVRERIEVIVTQDAGER